jgi:hypothetical protein
MKAQIREQASEPWGVRGSCLTLVHISLPGY